MTPQDAPTMPPQAPSTHHFVPIAAAVGILGLSATTIRRKIASGELVAEKLARPQGTAFLVQVPHDTPPHAEETPRTPQEPPETHHDAPPGAEYLAAVLAPLIATIERQGEQLISQAETIGELRAELAARKEPNSVLFSHALTPWLLSTLAIAAVVVLLGWP